MEMSQVRVGMKVYFGRPNGEQTLGEIIKINGKKCKVKTLQQRGSRSPAGVVWSVPYSMLRPENHVPGSVATVPLPPKVKAPIGLHDYHTMMAISGVYCSLSPENLSCDGELPAHSIHQRRAELERKLKGLFLAIGREVDEEECYEWLKSHKEPARLQPLVELPPWPPKT